jgi:hypothetical protein
MMHQQNGRESAPLRVSGWPCGLQAVQCQLHACAEVPHEARPITINEEAENHLPSTGRDDERLTLLWTKPNGKQGLICGANKSFRRRAMKRGIG